MTSWSLFLAPAWFLVAVALAAGRIVLIGAEPGAWRLEDVVGPLVVGWVIQSMIGSWSHLIPSTGPGGPDAHAAQRVGLGRAATGRLAALNGGALLLTVGVLLALPPVATVGVVVCVGATVASILVLVAAIAILPGGRIPRSFILERSG
ncbi:MAG TPA: hypothetical protein VF119_08515 [Candidatus Limnocylindrales bacterium]